jgi:hypothetical protein
MKQRWLERTVILRQRIFDQKIEPDYNEIWDRMIEEYQSSHEYLWEFKILKPYLLSFLRTSGWGAKAFSVFVFGIEIGRKLEKGELK